MASIFQQMQTRQIQKKANNFIKSLDKLSDKEKEQAYLDNKEFENNEIVLSYLFFKVPSIIRILPLEFQISRLNSNLNMLLVKLSFSLLFFSFIAEKIHA